MHKFDINIYLCFYVYIIIMCVCGYFVLLCGIWILCTLLGILKNNELNKIVFWQCPLFKHLILSTVSPMIIVPTVLAVYFGVSNHKNKLYAEEPESLIASAEQAQTANLKPQQRHSCRQHQRKQSCAQRRKQNCRWRCVQNNQNQRRRFSQRQAGNCWLILSRDLKTQQCQNLKQPLF